MMAPPTYYDLLGISSDATSTEVRKAYLKAAAASHPDKNPDAPKHVFQLVAEAYECLSDQAARQNYDHKLRSPPTPPPFQSPHAHAHGPSQPPPFRMPRSNPPMSFFQHHPPPRPHFCPVFNVPPPFIPRPPRPPPPMRTFMPRPRPPFAPPFMRFQGSPRPVPAFPPSASRAAEIAALLRRREAEIEALFAAKRRDDEDDGLRNLDEDDDYRFMRTEPLRTPSEAGGRVRATPENTAHLKDEYRTKSRSRSRSRGRLSPCTPYDREPTSTRTTPGVADQNDYFDVRPSDDEGRTRATPYNTAHLKQGADSPLAEVPQRNSQASAGLSRQEEVAARVQDLCTKWGVTEDELWERLNRDQEASAAPRPPPELVHPQPAPAVRWRAATPSPVVEHISRPPSAAPSWETAFTRFPNDSEILEPVEPPPTAIPQRHSAPRPREHAPPRPHLPRAQQSAPERRDFHSIPRKRSSQTMMHATSDRSAVDEWGMPLRPISDAELNRDLPPLPGQPPPSQDVTRGGYLSSMRRFSKSFISRKK